MRSIKTASVTSSWPLVTLLGVILSALLIAPIKAVQSGEDNFLIIEGATLIDGNGGPPLTNSVVIVEGNMIETVARKGEISYPPDATVLKADGKFIIPGLMDAHAHYVEWMAEMMLSHGVTSVFEIGGGPESHWAIAHRRAIQEGLIPGPRLFLSIGSVASGRMAAWFGMTGAETSIGGRQVANSPEQARQLMKEFISIGADFAKVHRGPSLDLYQAAIEEAHQAGLAVVAQPIGPTVYAREAILAGADILEHAAGISISIASNPSQWNEWGNIEEHSLDPTPFLDMDEQKAEDLIQLMIARNVYLEPDFICMGRGVHNQRDKFELQDYRLLNHPGLAYVPERSRVKFLGNHSEFDDVDQEDQERRRMGYNNMLRFIKNFTNKGGKVLTGTDSGELGWATPGLSMHHELELLVEAGLTEMEALMAATKNVAEAFRQLEKLGTVEEGKLADLVIINKNPLENITNTLDIQWVIQNGKISDRGYRPWFKNPLQIRNSVEGRTWFQALKDEVNRMRTPAFGQPSPGIQSIAPDLVTALDPEFTLTVHGAGFTNKSRVFLGETALPTRYIDGTQLEAIVDSQLIVQASTLPVTVTNPQPLQRPQWGGTSNLAYLLVNFHYQEE